MSFERVRTHPPMYRCLHTSPFSTGSFRMGLGCFSDGACKRWECAHVWLRM